jgi:hypothetical protein
LSRCEIIVGVAGRHFARLDQSHHAARNAGLGSAAAWPLGKGRHHHRCGAHESTADQQPITTGDVPNIHSFWARKRRHPWRKRSISKQGKTRAPAKIVDKLNKEINDALGAPGMKVRLPVGTVRHCLRAGGGLFLPRPAEKITAPSPVDFDDHVLALSQDACYRQPHQAN